MVLAASGFWLWTILFIVVWVALAFWPARVAGRKGHSFFGYFLFSLVFFPAALIVAMAWLYLYVPGSQAKGMVALAALVVSAGFAAWGLVGKSES